MSSEAEGTYVTGVVKLESNDVLSQEKDELFLEPLGGFWISYDCGLQDETDDSIRGQR